jgi:hypothetical protein
MADWTKAKTIAEMAKVYTDDQLFAYPKFAKNKLPNGISIYGEIPEFKTREQVLEWIDKNMTEEQVAYVGF